jgi:LacI family transcriptional regulator, repressor for deo operon, udp, cdd, tsx, nupC, and nupG
MANIEDVARAAGLSTATVSRAMRGLPSVAEETRIRVLETAARLGYVVSPQASGLASGQTRCVAVVVPFITRWYFSTLVQGVQHVLHENDYDLLLYNLAGDIEARHRVFQTDLLTKRVDGVIVCTIVPTEREAQWLTRLGRPITIVGARAEGISAVSIDDGLAARLAMRHLLERGHRRIAYIGGHDDHQLAFATPLARRTAYVEELARVGADRDPSLEVAATRKLLEMPSPPTAILAASDEMAFGALWTAREAGVRVPDELSVIGIDDHELSQSLGLTTVAQPVDQLGREAAVSMLAKLAGRQTAEADQKLLDLTLIDRGSTAQVRAGKAQSPAGG